MRWLVWTTFVALALVVVVAAVAGPAETTDPTFVDPTARIQNEKSVEIGRLVYVAPFAELRGGVDGKYGIEIGDESDVQDDVVVDAGRGTVMVGKQVILAHGATVIGPASIGLEGTCPAGAAACPSFVGINAEIDGAIIEKDAMVLHLARVAPGVRIPSGRRVLPGKSVDSVAEVATETVPVTEADRAFMRSDIDVNAQLARGYSQLAEENPSYVDGIGYDPGGSSFNPERNLPTFAGVKVLDPHFHFRVLGDVRLADDRKTFSHVSGKQISLRADQGEPFAVGRIAALGSRVIFHALEHTSLQLGDGGQYGFHSVVHGGLTEFGNVTITGENVTIGAWAVFFRSRIGAGSVIGEKSLVQQSDLPAGTVVPPRTVVVGNAVVGSVEW